MTRVLIRTKDLDTDTPKKAHVKTQGETAINKQASDSADTLTFHFQASRMVRESICVVEATRSVVLWYGSPSALI